MVEKLDSLAPAQCRRDHGTGQNLRTAASSVRIGGQDFVMFAQFG